MYTTSFLFPGEIKTKGILDREAVKSFTLYVKASDHGKPQPKSGYATVIISVADVNDNRPKFTKVRILFLTLSSISSYISVTTTIMDGTKKHIHSNLVEALNFEIYVCPWQRYGVHEICFDNFTRIFLLWGCRIFLVTFNSSYYHPFS